MAITNNAVANVDTGKPKVGGYALWAPIGTALPTDATTAVNAAFVNLGYVSNAGLKVTYDRATTDHRDWNGDVVETTTDEYTETYTVEFIESLRGDLLKTLFGAANVTIVAPTSTVDGSATVKHNASDTDDGCYVFEMKSRRSSKRVVIPQGRVVAIGEVSFVANNLIRYSVTLKAFPNAAGDCSYEYKTIPKTG